MEVSPDIHICGFCKQQYHNFEVFLAHKQNGCSLPTSDPASTTAITTLTGNTPSHLPSYWSICDLIHTVTLLWFSDSSTDFVIEESNQVRLMRDVKKILTKAQKAPSKKLEPAPTSKKHSCSFSGWCYSFDMTFHVTLKHVVLKLFPIFLKFPLNLHHSLF